MGFLIRVHGQEVKSYRRRFRGKRRRDCQVRRQEKFLYICNTLDLWEWEIRVLDIQEGNRMNVILSVWKGEAPRHQNIAVVPVASG